MASCCVTPRLGSLVLVYSEIRVLRSMTSAASHLLNTPLLLDKRKECCAEVRYVLLGLMKMG
jgi:hypothetical protein